MTAREEAHTKFTVDDREITTAWSRQFDQLDRMERKIEQLGRTQKRSNKETADSFRDVFAQVTGFTLGVEGAISALQKLIELQRQRQQLEEKQTISSAQRERALFKQLEIDDPAKQEAFRAAAVDLSRETHTSYGGTLEALQQAGTLGTSEKDLFGVARPILNLRRRAEGIGGTKEQEAEMTEAFVGFVKAFKRPLTAEEMEDASEGFFAMWLSNNIQTSDMPFISKVAPDLVQAGMTPKLALAFSAAMDTRNGPARAEAMKFAAQRFQTVFGNPAMLASLKAMGMEGDDVFTEAGEDPLNAWRNLRAGFGRVDPRQQAAHAKVIGGETYAGSILALAQDLDQVDRNLREMESVEGKIRRNDRIHEQSPLTEWEREQHEQEILDNRPASLERGTSRDRLANQLNEAGWGLLGDLIRSGKFDFLNDERGWPTIEQPGGWREKQTEVHLQIEVPPGDVRPQIKKSQRLSPFWQ